MIAAIVATAAPATAQRGASRASSAQTMTAGSARAGSSTAACTGARQIGTRIPASIALPIAGGIRVIARASAGQNPVSSSSAAHTRKAPMALAKSPVSPPAAIITAAPGVDQAKASGSRKARLSAMQRMPWPSERAKRPDAACAGVAPTATRPAMTSVNELAKPVSAAMRPAAIGCPRSLIRIDAPDDGRLCMPTI